MNKHIAFFALALLASSATQCMNQHRPHTTDHAQNVVCNNCNQLAQIGMVYQLYCQDKVCKTCLEKGWKQNLQCPRCNTPIEHGGTDQLPKEPRKTLPNLMQNTSGLLGQ